MPILYEAGDVLTKKGWILLHNPAQGVAMATINPRRDYTKAQKEFYLVITWRETAKRS